MNKSSWKGSVYTIIIYLKLLVKQNYKCAHCQIDLFELAENQERLFIVHHKNRNHDDDRLSNLILLCPSCHSKEHVKETIPAMKAKAPKFHSLETRKKISLQLKKNYQENPEVRKKISQAHKGIKHTEKTKQILSNKHKKIVQTRKRNSKGRFIKRRQE